MNRSPASAAAITRDAVLPAGVKRLRAGVAVRGAVAV